MAKTDEEVMEAAVLRIYYGDWSYDPVSGVIFGRGGCPIEKRFGNGYVRLSFFYRGRVRYLLGHRVIWTYVHGDIPDGLSINHKNSIRDDNRIANLEAISPRENFEHACRSGGVRRVLNAKDVNEIRRNDSSSSTRERLAKRFGVSSGYVWLVQAGLARKGLLQNGAPS